MALGRCLRQTAGRCACGQRRVTGPSWPLSQQARGVAVASSSAASGGASTSGSGGGGPLRPAVPRVEGEVINKAPVAFGLNDATYGYLLAHTREPAALRALREETAGLGGANMQVSPEQGAFLGLLAELIGARRALEVGVYTGYSSTAVALALPPDGRLVAMDRDERTMAVARRAWDAAGVRGRIEERLAPAADSLAAVLARDGPASYDLAFIDADKRGYDAYYEACLTLLRPGGLLAVDNVRRRRRRRCCRCGRPDSLAVAPLAPRRCAFRGFHADAFPRAPVPTPETSLSYRFCGTARWRTRAWTTSRQRRCARSTPRCWPTRASASRWCPSATAWRCAASGERGGEMCVTKRCMRRRMAAHS
jgi:predicted O-methyltransferase YrrM